MVSCVDGAETYRPETKIVLDIASAYLIFGRENVARTCKRLGSAVDKVCAVWNAKYEKQEVKQPSKKVLLVQSRV